MEKTNFKKWGWWAIGGVVAVLIIAVLIAAMGSGPKPTDDGEPIDDGDGQSEVVDDGDESDDERNSDEVATTEPETLPQSGPVEGSVLVLLLAGVFAYVMSLTLGNVLRAARLEKEV